MHYGLIKYMKDLSKLLNKTVELVVEDSVEKYFFRVEKETVEYNKRLTKLLQNNAGKQSESTN